jgi:signal transduction histidine kinase
MPFKGIIDDIRIYRAALTPDEVRQLYLSAGPLLPTVQVSSQTNAVHIGRTASFSSFADGSEPLSFQWRKDGSAMARATNQTLTISNLTWSAAGSYTLLVTNPYGSVLSSEMPLAVIPFFWQTWWFKLSPITLLIIAVGGIVRILERRKAKLALQRLERIHAVDHERMRITRDIHDEIGAKLSRISFLSDIARRSVDKQSMAAKQIDEVSEAARDVIHRVDEIVWAVNPRNDTLESLVHYICRHAEEFYELTSVELKLELPVQLPAKQLSAEVRHHLFCATKEALSNALKHAAATKVQVSFIASPSSFRILIKDNGRGFQTRPTPLTTALNRNRNGLVNIEDRLRSIHGEFRLESQPDTGTTVLLSIPLSKPS